MRRTIFAGLLGLTVLMLLAACGEDKSPAGPDDGNGEQEQIYFQGRLLLDPSIPIQVRYNMTINIHITGAETDTTFDSHMGNPFYSFSVPAGMYSITLTIGEPYNTDYVVVPASRTVTGVSGFVKVDPFLILTQAVYQSYQADALGVIYGYIVFSDSQGIGETTITVATLDGTVVNTTQNVYPFSFFDIPYGQYRVTPANDYYSFDPPDSTVTLDGLFGNADFTGEYAGPERFTISCRILSNVEDFRGGLLAKLNSDPSVQTYVPIGENGYIVSRPMIPGDYSVTLSINYPSFSYNSFEKKQLIVTITDSDIDLGEFTLNFIDDIYYTVNGTVTDAAGGGIEGVTVALTNDNPTPVYGNASTTTGADGIFTFSGRNYSTRGDIDMTVTATKSGWVFDPPSYTLIHSLDPTLATKVFTTPFIGKPAIMADYFPLAVGATWTFAHTADGVPSGTLTAEAGASFTAGGNTWVPLSGYMFGGLSGYRVDGAGMYAWNGQQQKTWAALNLATWDIGQINGISAKGARLASEDVTVPAGTFTDCRVIRITVPPNSPTAEITTYWLAEGVGPVKVEYTATSGGTVVQRITDELTVYQAP